MEDGHRKQETSLLLEEAVRSKSELNIRALSVPLPKLDEGERKEEEEDDDDEEEEDGARMGDLIRQAMPCKLARAPSLPASRMMRKEAAGGEVGMPRGPTISKLTRRSSMDPSLILLSKNISKSMGMKQGSSGFSTSKDQKRSEMLNRNMEKKRVSTPRYLERSMSLKNLSDKEVQGFQELGFTFEKEDLSSSVASKFDSMQIKNEPSMEGSDSASVTKWTDRTGSAEDVKAQIKFWARAVASNMNQE